MSSLSGSTIARSRGIIKSRKTQEYIDKLAANINDRGDGLKDTDVFQALGVLKAYDYKTVKVKLAGS
jgi:hypothetical protein